MSKKKKNKEDKTNQLIGIVVILFAIVFAFVSVTFIRYKSRFNNAEYVNCFLDSSKGFRIKDKKAALKVLKWQKQCEYVYGN